MVVSDTECGLIMPLKKKDNILLLLFNQLEMFIPSKKERKKKKNKLLSAPVLNDV